MNTKDIVSVLLLTSVSLSAVIWAGCSDTESSSRSRQKIASSVGNSFEQHIMNRERQFVIKHLSETTVWRPSGRSAKKAVSQDSAVLSQVRTYSVLDKMDSLVIVPLVTELQPVRVPILDVTADTTCSGKRVWDLTVPALRSDKYLTQPSVNGRREDFPFNVAIVYPGSLEVRSIPRSAITSEDLPGEFSTNVVTAAVSVPGPFELDGVVLEYCCDDQSISPDDLEENVGCHTCTQQFTRDKSGSWKRLALSGPC